MRLPNSVHHFWSGCFGAKAEKGELARFASINQFFGADMRRVRQAVSSSVYASAPTLPDYLVAYRSDMASIQTLDSSAIQSGIRRYSFRHCRVHRNFVENDCTKLFNKVPL